MDKEKIFDVVMIGSSPISLIYLLLKYKNKKILVLDNKASIGGNWSVSNIFGYENVETGPHYIKVRKNEERYLYFKINFSKNKFIPKIFINNFFKFSSPRIIQMYNEYHLAENYI